MKELPKYALNYLKGYKYLLKKRKIIGKTDRYFFFEHFKKWLGIGDWGLGIWDLANPQARISQSPNP